MNKPHNSGTKFRKRDIATLSVAAVACMIGTAKADAKPNHITAAKTQRIVFRAEAPYVMHNEVMASGLKVTCTMISAWAGKCLMRAYDGNKTALKLNLIVRRVPKHRTMMFEDYSGWWFDAGTNITYKIEPLD
jgi:hypothetical protein